MFPNAYNRKVNVVSVPDENPVIIQGADVYDSLCPVNELTGLRDSPLHLLRTLSNDPVRSRLINGLIAELPSIKSDSRLSDDDRVDVLMSRLSTGSPAEDDLFRQRLTRIVDVLLPSRDSESAPADFSAEPSPSAEPSAD